MLFYLLSVVSEGIQKESPKGITTLKKTFVV